MKQNFVKSLPLWLTLGLALSGCNASPVPPEVKSAELLEQRLWRAGAPDFSPQEYQRYRSDLRKAKDSFIREKGRFVWFRNYDYVKFEFGRLLKQGGEVLGEIRRTRDLAAAEVAGQYDLWQGKARLLEKLSGMMNEGRLARKNLTKAQILLAEVDLLRQRGNYEKAKARLFETGICLNAAEAALMPILSRFSDRRLISKWRQWANETISESKQKGITAIVVSKVDRSLVIYKNGQRLRAYEVGLGRNGMTDKLYSGDFATPEGKYHIISKLPQSRFFKSLQINYPDEEDWQEYAQAKKKGLVPPRVGIGGYLEIHGGGADGVTYGCIALDDPEMEEVYNLVNVGTPVTIVGSTDDNNYFSAVIDEL